MGTVLRVLIVDDCEDDAALAVRGLERAGRQVCLPFLKKPFTPEALVSAVRHALAGRAAPVAG